MKIKRGKLCSVSYNSDSLKGNFQRSIFALTKDFFKGHSLLYKGSDFLEWYRSQKGRKGLRSVSNLTDESPKHRERTCMSEWARQATKVDSAARQPPLVKDRSGLREQ